jgi:outer membrane protein OmpA-like peptidoglycan-associated protein
MKTESIKFFTTSLIFFSIFFTGCKKKNDTNKEKSSLFSKKSKSRKDKSAQAFDLDSDSMKSFAIDDKISKHKTSNAAESSSPMFSWEDQASEETKKLFQTIHFDFDKDFLKSSEELKLTQNIAQAKKMIKQGKTIVIEGHACHSAGSRAYNMAISERRARNVAQKFAEAGIDSSNIKIAPRGQEMPVRKGGNKQEQAVNRRVEIYAIDSK